MAAKFQAELSGVHDLRGLAGASAYPPRELRTLSWFSLATNEFLVHVLRNGVPYLQLMWARMQSFLTQLVEGPQLGISSLSIPTPLRYTASIAVSSLVNTG